MASRLQDRIVRPGGLWSQKMERKWQPGRWFARKGRSMQPTSRLLIERLGVLAERFARLRVDVIHVPAAIERSCARAGSPIFGRWSST